MFSSESLWIELAISILFCLKRKEGPASAFEEGYIFGVSIWRCRHPDLLIWIDQFKYELDKSQGCVLEWDYGKIVIKREIINVDQLRNRLVFLQSNLNKVDAISNLNVYALRNGGKSANSFETLSDFEIKIIGKTYIALNKLINN